MEDNDYYGGYPDQSDMSMTLDGLGQTTTTTTAATTAQPTSWWQDLLTAGEQAGTAYAQIQASKQYAKTGQVPTAQVNVGVAPDTKKMVMIGGGVALGILALYMFMRK